MMLPSVNVGGFNRFKSAGGSAICDETFISLAETRQLEDLYVQSETIKNSICFYTEYAILLCSSQKCRRVYCIYSALF